MFHLTWLTSSRTRDFDIRVLVILYTVPSIRHEVPNVVILSACSECTMSNMILFIIMAYHHKWLHSCTRRNEVSTTGSPIGCAEMPHRHGCRRGSTS